MRSKRVVMLSSYYYPFIGGAENYVKYVGEYLARKGWDVWVITKHFGDLKKLEVINGVKVYRIRVLNLWKMRSIFFLVPAYAVLKKSNPYIVHAHITYPNGILAMKLWFSNRIPYIDTMQGDELFDYPENAGLSVVKPFIGLALKFAYIIHSISNALKQSVLKNYKNLNDKKIIIIPNGIDTKIFSPKKHNELRKKYGADFIFINVSRLTKKNNILPTLYAFKNFLDETKSNTKYLIVGDGVDREKILRVIEELNLKDKVVLVGAVENTKVPYFLNGSDVYIRTPVTEGLGIAYLEAMACAIPVIASNVQGINDIVFDGFNGYKVEPNNVEEIKEVMIKMYRDKKRYQEMSRNAQKFGKQFDWETICKNTERLYELIDRIYY